VITQRWEFVCYYYYYKQSHTLPVLHFNRCLTTEYSETTAHCNGNFGTDNEFDVHGSGNMYEYVQFKVQLDVRFYVCFILLYS
jgi:hypothetical protein